MNNNVQLFFIYAKLLIQNRCVSCLLCRVTLEKYLHMWPGKPVQHNFNINTIYTLHSHIQKTEYIIKYKGQHLILTGYLYRDFNMDLWVHPYYCWHLTSRHHLSFFKTFFLLVTII